MSVSSSCFGNKIELNDNDDNSAQTDYTTVPKPTPRPTPSHLRPHISNNKEMLRASSTRGGSDVSN